MAPKGKGKQKQRASPLVIIDLEDETWVIRDTNTNMFEPVEEYVSRPGLFTIVFHHGAPTGGKFIHVYSNKIIVIEERMKLKRDQENLLADFLKVPSSGVVIEEIEEPEIIVQKPKLRKNKPLLLEWYERDEEFEEFLERSVVEDRERRKKESTENTQLDPAPVAEIEQGMDALDGTRIEGREQEDTTLEGEYVLEQKNNAHKQDNGLHSS
ncbi:hypothetical protein AAHA92_00163 [Salvia divinorum]|uniref:Uncharacterized protein n=1 Tax=Salvia divinorum TaxID=28513 RepID=A0ABD1ILE2_SALDI